MSIQPLHSVRNRLLFAMVWFSLFVSFDTTAQENLPPEPDMDALFQDLDSNSPADTDPSLMPVPDFEEDPSAIEPPPLPVDPATRVDDSMPSPELEPFTPESEDTPPSVVAPTTDDTLIPEAETPNTSEQNPSLSPIRTSTLRPLELLEYKKLRDALMEFLGTQSAIEPSPFAASTTDETALSDATPSFQNDLESDLSEFPPLPDDNATTIETIPDDAPSGTADGITSSTTNEEVFSLDSLLEDTPLTPPTGIQPPPSDIIEPPQPSEVPDTKTPVENTVLEEAPGTSIPDTEIPRTTAQVPLDDLTPEVVLPSVPSFSAEERAYLEEMDERSTELPDFARIGQEEKDSLNKPLEELAKEAKQDAFRNNRPAEEYDFARGEDLSSLDDISGHTTNRNFDVSVTSSDKKETFLSTDIQLEMAYRALLTGQLEAAIDIYKSVMDKYPDNQTALFGLASAYQKNQQNDEAKRLYQELLAVAPNHKEALNNFLVLITREAPEDALLQLQKMERVSPYFSPIPAQIGMVYYRMGEYEQAERYLRKAISMTPDNLSYLYNLAIVSDHLNNHEQSISLYERLLNESKKGKTIPGSIEHIKERLDYLIKQPS
jgi:tetratricopeptide (TPR) repeat protein